MPARILAAVTLCLVVQVGLMTTSQAVEPAAAYHVSATIPVPGPFSAVVDQQTSTLYVSDRDGIAVIDETTNEVTATIATYAPDWLAIDEVTQTLWVTSLNSDEVPTLTEIDLASNSVAATRKLPYFGSQVAIDPRTHRIFIVSAAGLMVINEPTRALKAIVPLDRASGVAVDSHTKTVYVTCWNAHKPDPGTVNAVDEKTDTVTASTTVGVTPVGVAVDVGTNLLYVANLGPLGTSFRKPSDVSVVDATTGTVTATIPSNHGVEAVALDPSTRAVYVTEDFTQGHVLVLNGHTKSLVAKLSVGSKPTWVAVDPSLHTAYIPAQGKNAVDVISRS